METQVIIMAGGIGSRLWPISTAQKPKQFIDILGCGKTLIQLTFERFLPNTEVENFWVVTSEQYFELVKEQLPQIPVNHILVEPVGRGTAPCIAYATWKIAKTKPNANLVFTPADALVLDKENFNKVLSYALEQTSYSDKIVTMGIRPTRPAVDYGYIKVEDKEQVVSKVNSFKEKPSEDIAKEYFDDGSYFWNAGIFVWNVKTIIAEFRRNHPQITYIMEKLNKYLNTDQENLQLKELFPLCENISIDYAIMEKSENIYMVTGNFDWSDLGTWSSLQDKLPKKDEQNNVYIVDNPSFIDSKDCLAYTSEIKNIIVEGLDGYLILQKGDNLMIIPQKSEAKIKEYFIRKV